MQSVQSTILTYFPLRFSDLPDCNSNNPSTILLATHLLARIRIAPV